MRIVVRQCRVVVIACWEMVDKCDVMYLALCPMFLDADIADIVSLPLWCQMVSRSNFAMCQGKITISILFGRVKR
jgi:hypothetical protein